MQPTFQFLLEPPMRFRLMFRCVFACLALLSSATSWGDTWTTLTTVPAAENALQTSDGRSWYISGSDGLYAYDVDKKTTTKVPISLAQGQSPSKDTKCYFTGLAEYRQVLYAACTPNTLSSSSPRYVLYADLRSLPLQMHVFHTAFEPGIYNGIAADTSGNLFLANTGGVIPSTMGKIVKLTMASYNRVAGKVDWIRSSGRVNGIKVDGDTVYYTENSLLGIGYNYVKKAAVKMDGTAAIPVKIFATAAVVDDFALVEGGLVLTSSLSALGKLVSGNVQHISETGVSLHSHNFTAWQPSSAALIRGSGDLLVTELKDGNVFVFQQNWGLKPRR